MQLINNEWLSGPIVTQGSRSSSVRFRGQRWCGHCRWWRWSQIILNTYCYQCQVLYYPLMYPCLSSIICRNHVSSFHSILAAELYTDIKPDDSSVKATKRGKGKKEKKRPAVDPLEKKKPKLDELKVLKRSQHTLDCCSAILVQLF